MINFLISGTYFYALLHLSVFNKIGLNRPKIVCKLTYFKQTYLPKMPRQQHVITAHLLLCVNKSYCKHCTFPSPRQGRGSISKRQARCPSLPHLLKLFLRCYDIFLHRDTHLKLVRIELQDRTGCLSRKRRGFLSM